MQIANNLGKRPLTGRAVIYKKEAVEDCLKICIFELNRAGHFRDISQRSGKPCPQC